MSNVTGSIQKNVFNIENANVTLERIIGFVNSCDNKASIFLGVYGVILTIIFTSPLFSNLSSWILSVSIQNNLVGVILLIAMIISLEFFIWGIYKFIVVLVANVKVSGKDSKIYFRDIAENVNIEQYKAKLMSTDEKSILDDLISQIYINSCICSKKYKSYNEGIKIASVGFAIFIIIYCITAILMIGR